MDTSVFAAVWLPVALLFIGQAMLDPASKARRRLACLNTVSHLTKMVKWVKVFGVLSLVLAGVVPVFLLLPGITGAFFFLPVILGVLGAYCVALAVIMHRFFRLF